MFRPTIFISNPAIGDYVVSATGFSWNVRRSVGDGSLLAVADAQPTRATALALGSRLAKDDRTDAWEKLGPDEFRLIQGSRPGDAREGVPTT